MIDNLFQTGGGQKLLSARQGHEAEAEGERMSGDGKKKGLTFRSSPGL